MSSGNHQLPMTVKIVRDPQAPLGLATNNANGRIKQVIETGAFFASTGAELSAWLTDSANAKLDSINGALIQWGRMETTPSLMQAIAGQAELSLHFTEALDSSASELAFEVRRASPSDSLGLDIDHATGAVKDIHPEGAFAKSMPKPEQAMSLKTEGFRLVRVDGMPLANAVAALATAVEGKTEIALVFDLLPQSKQEATVSNAPLGAPP